MVAGMDHFMGKPFNYVDLEAILEGHDSDKQAATAVWEVSRKDKIGCKFTLDYIFENCCQSHRMVILSG